MPLAPSPPSPAASEGAGGVDLPGRVRAAAAAASASSLALKLGLDRSGVASLPKRWVMGRGRRGSFRYRSQNRVRLVPAVSPAQGRRQWGWPGAAQPLEAEAPGGGDG